VRARRDVVARIGSLMLSVARVTRNIEAGTFLNFVRFVPRKIYSRFPMLSRAAKKITESTKKKQEARQEKERQARLIYLFFFQETG